MPLSQKKRHGYGSYIRIVAAAGAGVGLTLLLLLGFSVMIISGNVDESRIRIGLLASVFFGSVLTATLHSKCIAGILPHFFISWLSYMLILACCAFLGGKREIVGDYVLQTTITAGLGDISAVVTNLVKSNKSYINKSKRKR